MTALPWMLNEVRGRVLLGLLYANVASSSVMLAQRGSATFGPCADRLLGYSPAALTVSPRTQRTRALISVVHKQEHALSQYALSESGTIDSVGSFRTSVVYQSLLTLDLNGNGETEYVSLSAEGRQVSILRPRGAILQETHFPLDMTARQCVVTDINNDGKKDILLFGKSMTGVATLLGRGGTGYIAGPVLLPELSISDVAATDLNGDGIMDLVMLNWLSNQMVVYFGISGGMFSEQVTIDLPGEPGTLAISNPRRQRTIRVAITLPELRQVAVLTGNPAGEFELNQFIQCPGIPAGVQFARLRNDQFPDLVTMTDKGVMVSLATSAVTFAPPTVFGLTAGPGLWSVADVAGDASGELVLIEPHSRRMIVAGSTEHPSHVRWPDQYAVGASPRGVLLADFNDDGNLDLAVANSLSSNVSLLLNKGNGKFQGQCSVSVGEQPAFLSLVSKGPDALPTLVVSHPSAEKISVLRFTGGLAPSATFAIPTASNPRVVFAGEDPVGGELNILLRSSSRREASVSLSLFEQLSGRHFLERKLHPVLPGRILALTGGAFSGKDRYDLVLVSNTRGTKQSTLSIAQETEKFNFRTVTPVLSFADSFACTRAVAAVDVDGDAYTDVILVLSDPVYSLGIVFGKGDGTFREEVEWIRGVDPSNDDSIVLCDVDGDGLVDMTFVDALRQAVVTLYGLGGGKFSPPVSICSAAGVGEIAVGSLRDVTTRDLVMSQPEKGTVSILFSPFHR